MFCPNCGTQNVETVRFCRSCGANLGNVSDALAGKPVGISQSNFGTLAEVRGRNRRNKPISYESAITKMFTGLAFLIVAVVLGITGIAGGQNWWFWMLIPAFGSLGSGVAQYVQLKKTEKQNVSFASNTPNNLDSNFSNASLPPPSANQYELQNLVNSDRKIEAIKVYKETYGVSLKEAKDAVEAMERGQSLVNYDVPPPRGSVYDTGELVVPPSVTENTTRHLEMNSEGDTMTLPKK